MLGTENTTVRSIAWLEIFPWLRLIRLFRIAIQFRMLLFAAIGLAAMNAGWTVIEQSIEFFTSESVEFNTEAPPEEEAQPSLFDTEPTDTNPLGASALSENAPEEKVFDASDEESIFDIPQFSLAESFYPKTVRRIIGPVTVLLSRARLASLTIVDWIYLIACLLWATLVWGAFGVAACRAVALQLTIDHPYSISSMLNFGRNKWRSVANAILLPIGAILLLTLGLAFCAFLLNFLHLGIAIPLLWPICFLLGCVMLALAVGLYFGGPLMIAAVATENIDGFDAISRAYSCVFQRPLNALFYVAIAATIGRLGLWGVERLVDGAVFMTDRALALGIGSSAWEPSIYHAWLGWVPSIYVVAYFWAAAVGVYILLRRDVDQTEYDEVGGAEEALFNELPGVPPITKDERGAPVIEGAASEPVAEPASESTPTPETDPAAEEKPPEDASPETDPTETNPPEADPTNSEGAPQ